MTKELTIGKMTTPHLLLILTHSAMALVSLYLTIHFFDVHFPKEVNTDMLCNISTIFNCDSIAFSPLSNLFGVPIALFGLTLSLIFLFGSLFPTSSREQLNCLLSIFNAGGSLLLACYSIFIVHRVCPFCTLYHLLSFLSLYLFLRYGLKPSLKIKTLLVYASVMLALFLLTQLYISSKKTEVQQRSPVILNSFNSYPKTGHPATPSGYLLTEKSEAPLKISIISDFECPACKVLSELSTALERRYGDQLAIDYYFYPLDQDCNSSITRPFHQFACKASYLAACNKNNFKEVHDFLFENQANLSDKFLMDYAKKLNVVECYQGTEIKTQVVSIIDSLSSLNIQATPTIIINGQKIEGFLPIDQLTIILDDQLRQNER